MLLWKKTKKLPGIEDKKKFGVVYKQPSISIGSGHEFNQTKEKMFVLTRENLYHHQHTNFNYRIYIPIFWHEIISDGTRPKICYANIIPVRRYFFTEILLFGRWPMVIPSLITATVHLTLALVGSLKEVNSFPTSASHLSLYTCEAKCLYFSTLGGSAPWFYSLLISSPSFCKSW